MDKLIDLLDDAHRLQWHKGALSPEAGSWSGFYPGPRPTTPRDIAIRTLVAIGEPAVEPLIRALIDDPRHLVRAGAARALGGIGAERALKPLLAALEDESGTVRREAASALVAIDPGEGFYAQLAALQDPSYSVRLQAARELGQLADPRAVPALVLATEDKELVLPRPMVVREALRALAMIGDTAGLQPALAAMEHPDRLVREDAL